MRSFQLNTQLQLFARARVRPQPIFESGLNPFFYFIKTGPGENVETFFLTDSIKTRGMIKVPFEKSLDDDIQPKDL